MGTLTLDHSWRKNFQGFWKHIMKRQWLEAAMASLREKGFCFTDFIIGQQNQAMSTRRCERSTCYMSFWLWLPCYWIAGQVALQRGAKQWLQKKPILWPHHKSIVGPVWLLILFWGQKSGHLHHKIDLSVCQRLSPYRTDHWVLDSIPNAFWWGKCVLDPWNMDFEKLVSFVSDLI